MRRALWFTLGLLFSFTLAVFLLQPKSRAEEPQALKPVQILETRTDGDSDSVDHNLILYVDGNGIISPDPALKQDVGTPVEDRWTFSNLLTGITLHWHGKTKVVDLKAPALNPVQGGAVTLVLLKRYLGYWSDYRKIPLQLKKDATGKWHLFLEKGMDEYFDNVDVHSSTLGIKSITFLQGTRELANFALEELDKAHP